MRIKSLPDLKQAGTEEIISDPYHPARDEVAFVPFGGYPKR